MDKDNKKGFELGKSSDSGTGFELNKEGSSKPVDEKGFDLGKGDKESPSTFGLGKGEGSGVSSKSSDAVKKPSNDPPKTSKANEKAKSKSKQASVKSAKDIKSDKKTSPTSEKSKIVPTEKEAGGSVSPTSESSLKKKKSNTPAIIAVLVVITAGLYFILPIDSSSNEVDVAPSSQNESISIDDNQDQTDSPVESNVTTNSESSDDEMMTPTESSNESDIESGTDNDVANLEKMTESVTGSQAVISDNIGTSSENVSPISNSDASSISFNQNSTTVDISSSLVDEINMHLSSGETNRVVVEGHASSEGDDFYNIGLSRRRAEAVKDGLIRNGIDQSRIDIVANGSEYPIADNATQMGRIKNRRVEIKLD
tara:strand:- start:4862 stop:5968 length:1107 start_codon:yes stop_codon:yes gene_type:complete